MPCLPKILLLFLISGKRPYNDFHKNEVAKGYEEKVNFKYEPDYKNGNDKGSDGKKWVHFIVYDNNGETSTDTFSIS